MEKRIIEGKLNPESVASFSLVLFFILWGSVNLFGIIFGLFEFYDDVDLDKAVISLFISAVIAVLFYVTFNKTEIIVTDKRVYGKTSFGTRVDLPVDSISAVGITFLKSLTVTTASGAIRFFLIENRDDIHKELSRLLIERQEKKTENNNTDRGNYISVPDELKKYKELFDQGILTEEEFNMKKEQLLKMM